MSRLRMLEPAARAWLTEHPGQVPEPPAPPTVDVATYANYPVGFYAATAPAESHGLSGMRFDAVYGLMRARADGGSAVMARCRVYAIHLVPGMPWLPVLRGPVAGGTVDDQCGGHLWVPDPERRIAGYLQTMAALGDALDSVRWLSGVQGASSINQRHLHGQHADGVAAGVLATCDQGVDHGGLCGAGPWLWDGVRLMPTAGLAGLPDRDGAPAPWATWPAAAIGG